MNAFWFVTWSGVPASPSGPRVRSGSSARSGTKTVAPLLTVWSTPWSKNCPKNVNIELYGGERPTSVVTFGMKSVLCFGVQPAGSPGRDGASPSRRVGIARERAGGRVLRADRMAGSRDRGRVRRRLVDDQVAHDARRRVEDGALLLLVAGRRDRGGSGPACGHALGIAEARCRQAREQLIRGGETLAPREEVVARAVDGPQAVRREPVRDLIRAGADERATRVARRQRPCVLLGDLDLLR